MNSVIKLRNFYSEKKVTVKKVLNLFQLNSDVTNEQKQAFGFLKKYIKNLDLKDLTLFLRFVTGSDVMTVSKVDISFTTLEGVKRRPIARTCGPLLELPQTYTIYNELNEEFTNILHNPEAYRFNIV